MSIDIVIFPPAGLAGERFVCIDMFHRISQYSPVVVKILFGSRKVALNCARNVAGGAATRLV